MKNEVKNDMKQEHTEIANPDRLFEQTELQLPHLHVQTRPTATEIARITPRGRLKPHGMQKSGKQQHEYQQEPADAFEPDAPIF